MKASLYGQAFGFLDALVGAGRLGVDDAQPTILLAPKAIAANPNIMATWLGFGRPNSEKAESMPAPKNNKAVDSSHERISFALKAICIYYMQFSK